MNTIPKPSTKRTLMKPPFAYYGGKQKMAPLILPKLPPHELYCEPFTGGAAIFFAKEPGKVEVLNDTNKELINFYKICQWRFVELEKMISVTLHSRSLFNDASLVYNAPHMFDEVKRAWAVWTLGTMGFSGLLDGSWGYERKAGKVANATTQRRERFTADYAIRLQNVQIECADALHVIKSRDCEKAFFYVDPPYFNANMGHYDGYSAQDFENLLITLANIKGKFLLSSYDSELLQQYTTKNHWKQEKHTFSIAIGAINAKRKKKIEMLTWNY